MGAKVKFSHVRLLRHCCRCHVDEFGIANVAGRVGGLLQGVPVEGFVLTLPLCFLLLPLVVVLLLCHVILFGTRVNQIAT